MTLEAVIFGGLGTLAECAELDRAAWNAAFRAHDVGWNWSWDTYTELMRDGGDRQLAARFAGHMGEIVNAEALDRTHQKHLMTMFSGGVPLRPGVVRVLNWAARAGLKLALVSRTGQDPTSALMRATARARAGIDFDVAVLREDVSRMAPDPEAMVAALTKLSVGQGRTIVVADTLASAEAGAAAGLPVLLFPGALANMDIEALSRFPQVHVLAPEALTRAWSGARTSAAE